MKPFNPEKAQFYYDTASSFQDALVKSSNQLLEYEDKIRTLKNENDELKKQVDSLVSNLAAAHEDRNEEAKSVFLAKQVEIPELLRENAALRKDYIEMGKTALKSEINHYIGSIIMTDEQRKLREAVKKELPERASWAEIYAVYEIVRDRKKEAQQ